MRSKSIDTKKVALSALLVTASLMSGCANLGKPEFTCNGIKKDGVCAGPHDIYALTNNRENLETLTLEELDKQVNKEKYIAHNHGSNVTYKDKDENEDVVTYKPRTLEQQNPYQYQKAEVVPQKRFSVPYDNEFGAWPNNGEPMAPEAMAVMSEPMPMRVLVTAYKDESGALNMPGYVFVNVQPQEFKFGRDANLRPSRVIPLKMKQESAERLNRLQQRSSGVDPLGIENPINEK